MTVVEMAGMVGSGKTTLATALADDLGTVGCRVLSAKEAIPIVLDRSVAGRAIRLVARTADLRRLYLGLYRRLVRPWYAALFLAQHPGPTRLVIAALRRADIRIRHRLRIFGLFVWRGTAQLFLGPRMASDEILLLEEGLVHRAVNVFSWNPSGVDRIAVQEYLTTVPTTDLVVFVEATTEISVDRAQVRGLPKRLTGVDEATVRRFMSGAAEVVAVIATSLTVSTRPHVVVDNDGPLFESVASLRKALAGRLAPP